MSDRRPENAEITRAFRAGWAARGMAAVDDVTIHAGYRLCAEIPGPGRYLVVQHNESAPTDLIAAVRRGVESGTIKGRVMRECEHGLLHEVDPDTEGWDLRCSFNNSGEPCQMSVTLVIPVSDGGSET